MNWRLARNADGEPEIDTFREDPDEDLSVGYTLLALLAPDTQLRELRPGVWMESKLDEKRTTD